MTLPRCKFGDKCHDKSDGHIKAFSHPCPYGDKCYRKNAEHKVLMTHGDADAPKADSRYFECTTAGHHKYWQSRVSDKSSEVRYGKIGHEGAVQIKKHDSHSEAVAYVEKHIAEKLKKGYIEHKMRAWSPPDSPSSSPKPKKKRAKDATSGGSGDSEEEEEADPKADDSRPRRFENDKEKEFWVVSREGTNLRIGFGSIDSAGSSGLKPFVSVEKAKEALAKMIEDKTKAGYKELKGARAKVFAVKAWRPVCAADDATCPPTGSKFMGGAFIPTGTTWPTCGDCGSHMPLFLQINLEDLMGKPGLSDYGSKGLLQLFYCSDDCDGGYEPFSTASCCRVVDPKAPGSTMLYSSVPPEFASGVQITSWDGPLDDRPNYEEGTEMGLDVSEEDADHDDKRPLAKDKLGGWPDWVQGVEYPDCTVCSKRMRLLFQVDSEDNIPFTFGDVGCGHITQCEKHRHVVAFGWACG